MKTRTLIFCQLLVLLIAGTVYSQESQNFKPFTRDAIFDTVYDQQGNKFALKDIQLDSPNPFHSKQKENSAVLPGKKTIGSVQSVNAVPPLSCTAGYFDLYFAPGSCFDGNSSAAVGKRAVLCQLMQDISGFINSSLPNSVRINILCGDILLQNSGPAATASPIHVFPAFPANANPGITDSQIYKALVGGYNPYQSLPINVFPASNNFYYGYINVEPSITNFNTNLSTATIGANEFDFYSVMLHEVTHALGFMSLISGTGVSKYGAVNNYYGRYDMFLQNASGTPLLKANNPSCPNSNIVFQVPVSSINPNNCPGTPDITNCATAVKYSSFNVLSKVYTPGCFSDGSSLSHFEDMCTVPPGFTSPCSASPPNNNLYYVMSNGGSQGNCYVKRHLTKEERLVLCDLGYKMKPTYSSPVPGATFNYGGGTCPGSNVWGVDDGIVNGQVVNQFISTNSYIVIPNSTILGNDSPGATIECAEIVYSNTASAPTFSNPPGTPTPPNGSAGMMTVQKIGSYSGLVVVKYLPKLAGKYGNPTYIFIYFVSTSCSPPDPCNMVQNGGFESLSSGACGGFIGWGTNMPVLSCWNFYESTPDRFARNCPSSSGLPLPTPFYNLGVNTMGINPPINTFIPNAANNNAIMGFVTVPGLPATEALQNCMSAPLVYNSTYEVGFWVYNYSGAFNAAALGAGNFNPGNMPIVVTVASAPICGPSGNFPASANVVAEFTVPATGGWTYVSKQFTFNQTANHSALIIGMDAQKTGAYMPTPITNTAYCFIDEVSLKPLPAPTFVLPLPACPFTLSNLAQYASAIPGTFSGQGVTLSNGQYNFNVPPTLVPGSYPIGFNYTAPNGCQQTLWQVAVVPQGPPVAVNGPFTHCSYLPTGVNLTANLVTPPAGGAVYNWLPGNLPGQNVSVGPSVNTIYTVVVNASNCISTNIVQVNVTNNCCPQTVGGTTPFVGTAFLDRTNITSLTGPIVIDQDITIGGPAGIFSFQSGDFLMAPGVKITLQAGIQLDLSDAHLHSCNATMWQGIIVQDGANVTSAPNTLPTLIEDAEVAIDIDQIAALHVSPLLALNGVIFNKNFIGIKFHNGDMNPLQVLVKSCVFTCRDLPYGTMSWPGSSTTSPDLRYAAVAPIVSIAPPYLFNNYPGTTLNAPHNHQLPDAGIRIEDMTNGWVAGSLPTSGVELTSWANPVSNEFNLFDNLNSGIDVINASLTTYNNEFQNIYALSKGAINHVVNTNMNARLSLSPQGSLNKGKGNHFWDCWRGINAFNVFEVDVEQASFRSTQHTGASPSPLVGQTGIYLLSNRFSHRMRNNEFNNVKDGIQMLFYQNNNAGYNINGAASTGGVYADSLVIQGNHFSPQIGGSPPNSGEYVNNAILMYGDGGSQWNVNNTDGLIKENKIENCFRGIDILQMNKYPVNINNNSIQLADDYLSSNFQFGIKLQQTLGEKVVQFNTLTGTGISNQNMALVYCPAANHALRIKCNSLNNAFQGFVYSGNNTGEWTGNKMNGLYRGLVLGSNAVIGQQGSVVSPSGNEWSGCTFDTYVAGADALNSPLYANAGSPYTPVNNGNSSAVHDYNFSGALNVAYGAYSCAGGCPQASVTPVLSATALQVGGVLNGPIIIDHDITIGGGFGDYTFQGGDFIMGPGVKITVQPYSNLVLSDAHLYACNYTMWKGIVVQDKGNVRSMQGPNFMSTLIEDAEVAIDVDQISSSHSGALLDLDMVIFNKNRTGIYIHNSAERNILIYMRSCVFTCRDLQTTSTWWPLAATTNPMDLRYTASSAGTDPPYLQAYAPATLKAPYLLQGADAGVRIEKIDNNNTAGILPSGGVDLFAFAGPPAHAFNLYDNLAVGIDVIDASLTTANNVFQNIYSSTKAAINQVISTNMNARLSLTPQAPLSSGTGNHFWECYRGIYAYNVLEFDIEQASFRSRQHTGLSPASVGETAIYLTTNRFNYRMRYNEFSNYRDGIFMDVMKNYGINYDVGGAGPLGGVYADSLVVNKNYFGAQVMGQTAYLGEFMRRPIVISGLAGNPWNIHNSQNFIQSNVIDGCFNGIDIYQMYKYPINISNNTIGLVNDIVPTNFQYGIQLTQSQGGRVVSFNKITGSSLYNYNMALVNCMYINVWPEITCNNLSNAYQGFVFMGNHKGIWNGNIMSNLDRGLVLSNGGIIGQQGSSTTPSGNQWFNCNFDTYVIVSSNALNSPLYVSNAPSFIPVTNGVSSSVNGYNATGAVIISNGDVYNCPILDLLNRTAAETNLTESGTLQVNGIKVFPNPTWGNVTVASENGNEYLQVKITDLTGKILIEKAITANEANEIDISSLKASMYFIEIRTSDNKILRSKLIKN